MATWGHGIPAPEFQNTDGIRGHKQRTTAIYPVNITHWIVTFRASSLAITTPSAVNQPTKAQLNFHGSFEFDSLGQTHRSAGGWQRESHIDCRARAFVLPRKRLCLHQYTQQALGLRGGLFDNASKPGKYHSRALLWRKGLFCQPDFTRTPFVSH